MSDLGLDAWLPVRNEADIIAARQKGRAEAAELGFDGTDVILIATAISEIARNMVEYAKGGEMRFERIEREGRLGLRIVARDRGPGIANVELAMQDGYTTGRGLGLGLPGARRLVDDFNIQTAPGEGTRVTLVKWTRA